MYDMTIEILRHPEKADWERCKTLTLNTVGKKFAGGEITDEWKHKLLKAGHSPIRTLMFTIRFSPTGMTVSIITIGSLHHRMPW